MKRGFTLIEVLVSAAILILVALAVVAISNSISQTTLVASDTTVASYQAQQNLNIISKIRDDNISNLQSTTDGVWFGPAGNPNYGWYVMTDGPSLNNPSTNTWSISQINNSAIGNVYDPTPAELVDVLSNINISNAITTDTTSSPTTYQIICVEPYGANDDYTDPTDSQSRIPCDTVDGQNPLTDGARVVGGNGLSGGSCQAADNYCNDTKPSLNNDGADFSNNSFYIPAGNAVKIKSVIIWQTQSTSANANYKYTAVSSLLTNWETAGGLNEQAFGN